MIASVFSNVVVEELFLGRSTLIWGWYKGGTVSLESGSKVWVGTTIWWETVVGLGRVLEEIMGRREGEGEGWGGNRWCALHLHRAIVNTDKGDVGKIRK